MGRLIKRYSGTDERVVCSLDVINGEDKLALSRLPTHLRADGAGCHMAAETGLINGAYLRDCELRGSEPSVPNEWPAKQKRRTRRRFLT
jgi:hypothetical protein